MNNASTLTKKKNKRQSNCSNQIFWQICRMFNHPSAIPVFYYHYHLFLLVFCVFTSSLVSTLLCTVSVMLTTYICHVFVGINCTECRQQNGTWHFYNACYHILLFRFPCSLFFYFDEFRRSTHGLDQRRLSSSSSSSSALCICLVSVDTRRGKAP